MKDKEMIEEMAKVIEYAINNECKLNNGKSCEDCVFDNKGDWHCQNLLIATHLYGERYRKLPEDSVVLSKGAYESLSSKAKANVVNAVEIRKETAKKFYNMIYWKAVKYIKGKNKDECFIEMSFEKLDELAKQFGLEIKE